MCFRPFTYAAPVVLRCTMDVEFDRSTLPGCGTDVLCVLNCNNHRHSTLASAPHPSPAPPGTSGTPRR